MAKRKRRSKLHQIVVDAAKEVRKKKLTFEREASRALSEALGFEVTVKIKRTKPVDPIERLAARARYLPERVNADLDDQIDFNEPF